MRDVITRAPGDSRIRIGITGHMNLSDATTALVARHISQVLVPLAPDGIVGVSCLARGADSIFAAQVLEAGGELEVILPASSYRVTKVKPEDRPLFDNLVSLARNVVVMPFDDSSRQAYEAANNALLERIDRLMAVWDGKSSVDQGGTAAVVGNARDLGIPVEIIWPPGAERVSQ